ncbi:MAG: hypothetical protein AAGE59_22340 [Cyanobacteria bacterium P01_F01_bin.86]
MFQTDSFTIAGIDETDSWSTDTCEKLQATAPSITDTSTQEPVNQRLTRPEKGGIDCHFQH